MNALILASSLPPLTLSLTLSPLSNVRVNLHLQHRSSQRFSQTNYITLKLCKIRNKAKVRKNEMEIRLIVR